MPLFGPGSGPPDPLMAQHPGGRQPLLRVGFLPAGLGTMGPCDAQMYHPIIARSSPRTIYVHADFDQLSDSASRSFASVPARPMERFTFTSPSHSPEDPQLRTLLLDQPGRCFRFSKRAPKVIISHHLKISEGFVQYPNMASSRILPSEF